MMPLSVTDALAGVALRPDSQPVRIDVTGHLLTCPTGGDSGLSDDYSTYLYLAPDLDHHDDLSQSIILDDPQLYARLLGKKMPRSFSRRYGGVCYKATVRGVLRPSPLGLFPASMGLLEEVRVWVPEEDAERIIHWVRD